MTNSPAKLCAKFVGYDVREPLSRLLFSASCLLSLVPCLPYCKCFRFNVIDNNLMAKSLNLKNSDHCIKWTSFCSLHAGS